MTRVLVVGNTYPVKDQLRALGGRWDADKRGWMVPAERAGEARLLVAGAPKSPYAAPVSKKRARARMIGICTHCGDDCGVEWADECGYR